MIWSVWAMDSYDGSEWPVKQGIATREEAEQIRLDYKVKHPDEVPGEFRIGDIAVGLRWTE